MVDNRLTIQFTLVDNKFIKMISSKVPVVGQAFADEIFRVFQDKHPEIRLETENMNEGVRFMVQRAIKTERG